MNDIGMVFRYMEIVVNLGLAVGPALGGALINSLKYEGTLYLFGAINGLCIILCIFMIPKSMNKSPNLNTNSEVNIEKLDVGWLHLL